MAFTGKDYVRSKIVIKDRIIEQINKRKYQMTNEIMKMCRYSKMYIGSYVLKGERKIEKRVRQGYSLSL